MKWVSISPICFCNSWLVACAQAFLWDTLNTFTVYWFLHSGAHKQEEYVSCCSYPENQTCELNCVKQFNTQAIYLHIPSGLRLVICISKVEAALPFISSPQGFPVNGLSFSRHPSPWLHPLPAFTGWALLKRCHFNCNADSKGVVGGTY